MKTKKRYAVVFASKKYIGIYGTLAAAFQPDGRAQNFISIE